MIARATAGGAIPGTTGLRCDDEHHRTGPRSASSTASTEPGPRHGIAAIIFFFFVLWTNLAVVLIQFHGVPQIVASSVVVVLLIPIVRALIVERQPPAITPFSHWS